MGVFGEKRGKTGDTVITLFAVFSIILAGGISIATITTDQNTEMGRNISIYDTDPLTQAEQAAIAGIHAVKGHIECHGITENGGLPYQYYANGARFEAVWDDIDLADSTVHIISTGYSQNDLGEKFTTKFESIIKVDLITAHNQSILHDYYRANRENNPDSDIN
jgi:hypothetical protein